MSGNCRRGWIPSSGKEGMACRKDRRSGSPLPEPFLIMDEATSALDEATEVAVLQGLRALEPRPTCLLITHRKGVLKYCDRELCIREGSVTEECSTTTICTA